MKTALKFSILSSLAVSLLASEVVLDIETATKVQFSGKSGKSYQVYSSTNLDQPQWVALGAPQAGADDLITFFHTTRGDQKVFFKVEESNATQAASAGTPLAVVQRARLNLLGQDLSGMTLTNLDLSNFTLNNVNFRDANLDGSILTNAAIGGANFSHALLQGANLRLAHGSGVNFTKADLTGAILGGQDGNFQNAILQGATVASTLSLSGDFTGGNCKGLIAQNTVLSFSRSSGADFTGSDFSNSDIAAHSSFAGANLTGVKFNHVIFSYDVEDPHDSSGINFDGADLTNADLTGAQRFYEGQGTIFNNTTMPDGTLRTGLGHTNSASALLQKTLQLNYQGGGGEKFQFITATTFSYENGADTGTYVYDSNSGNLTMTRSGNGSLYQMNIPFGSSSGNTVVSYQEPGGFSDDTQATFTLQPPFVSDLPAEKPK
jgi:uncharacterized protein YjbI with pentapeptide repeats